ncbi:hypothetical protein BGZ60DRAFT_409633 [Tricladium varicosporioides]|nr:hypothetical protein BGZ60DRAFT_409633 [Hymenoscyphus varicosporioides]
MADPTGCSALNSVLIELEKIISSLPPKEWGWECLADHLSKYFNPAFLNSHKSQILGHCCKCIGNHSSTAFSPSQMETHFVSPAPSVAMPMTPPDSKCSSTSSNRLSQSQSQSRSPDQTLQSRLEYGFFRINPSEREGAVFSFSNIDELSWINEKYISQRGLGRCVRNNRITLEFSFDSNLRQSYKLEFNIKNGKFDARLGTKWDVVDSGPERPRQRASRKEHRRTKGSVVVSNIKDAANFRQEPGLNITLEVPLDGVLQISSIPSTRSRADPFLQPSSNPPRILLGRNNIHGSASTEELQLPSFFSSPSIWSARRNKQRDSDNSDTTDSELWDDPDRKAAENSDSSVPNSRDSSRDGLHDRLYPLDQHKSLEEQVTMNPWSS